MTATIRIVVVFIYAFKNEWYQYLLPFWYLEHSYLQYIGWGLLLLSLVLVWIAQSQMANSWRIGIDEKNKTELVTRGLFAYSRNPIFLGVMIANFGPADYNYDETVTTLRYKYLVSITRVLITS